jgi:hypothetical protein
MSNEMLNDDPYCDLCATNYDEQDPNGFDYRFDYPVCMKCVEKYNLEPDEED